MSAWLIEQTKGAHMTHQDYTPIACGLHEEFQLAAMRGALLDVNWESETGVRLNERLRVLDVFTRDQPEYLSGETTAGARRLIRLDRIHQALWAETGVSLQGAGE
jgi:transcriptional antiterminator Rof (Rho-off)